jgi:hypothetical protein
LLASVATLLLLEPLDDEWLGSDDPDPMHTSQITSLNAQQHVAPTVFHSQLRSLAASTSIPKRIVYR